MSKARAALLDLRRIAKALIHRNGHEIEYWLNKENGNEIMMYAKCEKCGATAKVSVDNKTEKMFGNAIEDKCSE